MADPDPQADMTATRLKPAEWTAPSPGITGEGREAATARRSGLRSILPWLLLLLGVVAGIALATMGGFRPPWGAGPTAVAPAVEPAPAPAPVGPARDPLVEELASRLAALEASRSGTPTGAAAAGGESAPVQQRLNAIEADLRRLAEAGRMTEARIDALINDLDSAGATSGAAAASTARARDFFILLGVRRQVERGRPLGALEPALMAQFEGREPAATAALAAWSRAPMSPSLLAEQLMATPASAKPRADTDGLLARMWRGLRSMVELRRADEESSRLVRARAAAALARGDLASAIAIVETAGPATAGDAWLGDARRLSAALDGLDRLELIALQDATASAPVPPTPNP